MLGGRIEVFSVLTLRFGQYLCFPAVVLLGERSVSRDVSGIFAAFHALFPSDHY